MIVGGKMAKQRLAPRFVCRQSQACSSIPWDSMHRLTCQPPPPPSDAILQPYPAQAGSDRGSNHEQGQKVLARSGLGQAGTSEVVRGVGACTRAQRVGRLADGR